MNELTVWQRVLQSFLCHRDWTAATHLSDLDWDGYDIAKLGPQPEAVVEKWLGDMRERFPDQASALRATIDTPPTPLVLTAKRFRETSRANRGELLGSWKILDGEMELGILDKVERMDPQGLQGNVATSYRRTVYFSLNWRGYAINHYGKTLTDAVAYVAKEITRMREGAR